MVYNVISQIYYILIIFRFIFLCILKYYRLYDANLSALHLINCKLECYFNKRENVTSTMAKKKKKTIGAECN